MRHDLGTIEQLSLFPGTPASMPADQCVHSDPGGHTIEPHCTEPSSEVPGGGGASGRLLEPSGPVESTRMQPAIASAARKHDTDVAIAVRFVCIAVPFSTPRAELYSPGVA
jgi:hypothetical protein